MLYICTYCDIHYNKFYNYSVYLTTNSFISLKNPEF